MAHEEQRKFCESVKERFPEFFKSVLVLDIGSLDINGSNHYLFDSDCFYIGLDIAPGRNVDIVTPAHELNLPAGSFEQIISVECLEHDRYWEKTLQNAVRLLCPGGLLLITCATTGRAEHGTRRTSPQDAPLLGTIDEEWADYYRNLTRQDFEHALNLEKEFRFYEFSYNESSHDLYFIGIKRGTFEIRRNRSINLGSHPKCQEIGYLKERIASLSQEALERTAMAVDLNNAVVERDNKIDGLMQSIVERECREQVLNQSIKELDEELATLKLKFSQLDALLCDITNSKIWRTSQPLRSIGTKIKSFNTLVRPIRKGRDIYMVMQRFLQNHTLQGLVVRTGRVIKNEGLDGVRARVRRQHLINSVNHSGLTSTSLLASSITPAEIKQDGNDNYILASDFHGYCYVEPSIPHDFSSFLDRLDYSLLFSIVVPVYNATSSLLNDVLKSVRAQWYTNWELILVDDASPSLETRALLNKIDDPKIKIITLPENQGISSATNAGIEKAAGEFVVFMDHDDELTVDCLFELARCIALENPDFIYSDEDKISPNGEYVEPHFKPDWSPDTMMSTMFTCHVSCVRRSVVSAVGGLRSEFDGCQDWDFVLRVAEYTQRISHIPRVLYHWRIIPASIAADIAAKPYVQDASRRVREEAIKRRGLSGCVEDLPNMRGYSRIKYNLQGIPLISIIIPTRDNEQVLRRCIDSIFDNTSYSNFEIVVLDNGSVAPECLSYFEELSLHDKVTIISHDKPFNFSELNNVGVNNSSGQFLVFLNDDTEVLQEDWLQRLGGYAQLAHVGAVGAKLLYPGENRIQHAGILNLLDGPGHAFLHQYSQTPGYYMRNLLEYNWIAVTGACMMVERSKFSLVGGFAECLPVAYNDIDLCMRLVSAGYFNVVVQAVQLIHHESASRGHDHLDVAKLKRLRREKTLLYQRNPTYFQYDPFFNVNLHPNGINFELPN